MTIPSKKDCRTPTYCLNGYGNDTQEGGQIRNEVLATGFPTYLSVALESST